jgi:hypothetical protein
VCAVFRGDRRAHCFASFFQGRGRQTGSFPLLAPIVNKSRKIYDLQGFIETSNSTFNLLIVGLAGLEYGARQYHNEVGTKRMGEVDV